MLSINDLSFSYKSSTPLIQNLDLNVKAGGIYGLLGLNGAGKSTLLNIISGMLFPKKGTCSLHGNLTKTRSIETLRELYILPEQFDLPKITGDTYTNIHSPLYPRFDRKVMNEILKVFEVDPSKQLNSQSFGQRKKFLIAFSIATNSSLLLFDEPTNGLDIPSKSQFRRIVASLEIQNRAILISTHQVRDLGSMIDHMIVLKDGKIAFNRSMDEIEMKLAFQTIDQDSPKNYLYGEETLGGIQAILPSYEGKSQEGIDLELLFNSIILKTGKMNDHFNGVSS